MSSGSELNFAANKLVEEEKIRTQTSDDASGDKEEADKLGGKRKGEQIEGDAKKKKKITFEQGQVVELKDLLFNQDMDYLIKYNSKQQVNADHLANKVVVLHFVSLHPKNESWDYETAYLVDIYDDLQSQCLPFEVIFVPAWNAGDFSHQEALEKRYEEIFSFMPWTAIPLDDVKCCKHLTKNYGYCGNSSYSPASIVVSQSGEIYQHNAILVFSRYGSAGYPFNNEKIRTLISQDYKAIMHPSVTALLGDSSDRSYVIDNKGDKIPVTLLENKVVALYFYQDGRTDDLVTELEKAYLAHKSDFEVVLVYIHDSPRTRYFVNETSFNETFAKMPWLALPFKDIRCMKVQRVFEYPVDYDYVEKFDRSLVIIGRNGEFCEPVGAEILRNFGSLAYPFTRKRAVEFRVEKAKGMKLDMFWCQETVFTSINGSYKVHFSKLKGKKIIVFFYKPMSNSHDMFVKKLEERYLQDKHTSKEFEVIHIMNGKTGSSVPWLIHPPFDKGSNAEKCLRDVFPSKSGLLAFNADGTVARARENPSSPADIPFPFSYGDFELDAQLDLLDRFAWFSHRMTGSSKPPYE